MFLGFEGTIVNHPWNRIMNLQWPTKLTKHDVWYELIWYVQVQLAITNHLRSWKACEAVSANRSIDHQHHSDDDDEDDDDDADYDKHRIEVPSGKTYIDWPVSSIFHKLRLKICPITIPNFVVKTPQQIRISMFHHQFPSKTTRGTIRLFNIAMENHHAINR